MTEDAATIRAALTRLNRAENSFATLGLEPMIAVFDDVLADDWEGTTNDGPLHGREEERASERMNWAAFPDYHRNFETVIIEPPLAAVRWTVTGTHTGDFPGFPASGNRVTVTGMSMFEFQGGRVCRSHLHVDMGGLGEQLARGTNSR